MSFRQCRMPSFPSALTSKPYPYGTKHAASGIRQSRVRQSMGNEAIAIRQRRHSMTTFRISDTIRRTETPDGGILLDVHHGQLFGLNVVGAKILALMERGYDESQIADEISGDYGVNKEVVRAHVIEFIETLHKHHVLQTTRAANAT